MLSLKTLVKENEEETTVSLSGIAKTDKEEVMATGTVTLKLLLQDVAKNPRYYPCWISHTRLVLPILL